MYLYILYNMTKVKPISSYLHRETIRLILDSTYTKSFIASHICRNCWLCTTCAYICHTQDTLYL